VAAKEQVRCPQCGVPNEPGALFCSRCGASLNRPGYKGTRRRRVSLAGFVMALAMLLALGVTTFVLYTIVTRVLDPSTDTTVDPYAGVTGTLATLTTSTTSGTNTGGTDGVTGGAILVRPSSVTASSIMQATNMADFGPTNLLDGDPSSAWVEGASDTGVGEWVRLEFADTIPLSRIEIANGYQKDQERFSGNARVKSLELQYSNGVVQVVQLRDVEGLQVIEPSTDETQWIKATILSIYPTYVWPEAALSEMRVYEATR
jgi:predicted nucleic acid-binding Zn ribbon protein